MVMIMEVNKILYATKKIDNRTISNVSEESATNHVLLK